MCKCVDLAGSDKVEGVVESLLSAIYWTMIVSQYIAGSNSKASMKDLKQR